MSYNQQEQEILAQLRARLLQQGHRTLKEEYGSVSRGVPTGPDRAFVVDGATRDALLSQNPQSASLLKPFIEARHVNKWRIEEPGQWLLHIPAGAVDINEHPAILQYLQPFREQLEKRPQQNWFELPSDATDDVAHLVQPKIVCFQNAGRPIFNLDRSGAYFADTGLALPREDYYLLGVLNSRLHWCLLEGLSAATGTDAAQIQAAHIEALPFPIPTIEHRGLIGGVAQHCMDLAQEREGFHAHMRREIAKHIAPGGSVEELSARMNNWHMLDVFTLRDEVRSHFGQEIAQDQLPLWEGFLSEGTFQLNKLNEDIDRCERQIDASLYAMFGLTEEEIELLYRK